MTGLEKIVQQITDDASSQAQEILAKAKAQTEEILTSASEQAEALQADIAQKSEKEIANYRKRAQSSLDLQKRTAILEAKQEMISYMLEAAYKAVCKEDPSAYFSRMEKMLQLYAQPGAGEIRFNQTDLDRMPEGFAGIIEKAAQAAGGSLTLSAQGADIENGFVLVYGGIEENCTLRAVFDAKKDALTDKVHQLLYR